MSEALVTNYDEVQELKGQLAELRKDKERLDWLLKTQSFLSINRIGTRKDIDKEME